MNYALPHSVAALPYVMTDVFIFLLNGRSDA